MPKLKVIDFDDYMLKAGKTAIGKTDVMKAIELLENENEVLREYEYKGRRYIVVKEGFYAKKGGK